MRIRGIRYKIFLNPGISNFGFLYFSLSPSKQVTIRSQLLTFQLATYFSTISWKFWVENLRHQLSFENWYCHIFLGPFISFVFGSFSFISHFLIRRYVSLPSFHLLSPVFLITTRFPHFPYMQFSPYICIFLVVQSLKF